MEMKKKKKEGGRQTDWNKYSEEVVLNAVKGSGAIMSIIADRLGVTWKTARVYVLHYPSAVEAFEHEENKAIDEAQSQLFEKVKAGDLNAIEFYLSKKGRRKGWGSEAEALNWKGVLKEKDG